MYVLPKDPRQRRTKENIFKTFTALLEDRQVSQISVSEVSKLAGVSRKTFYKYYPDQFGLLAAIQDDLFEGFKGALEQVPPNIFEVVPVLVQFADEHRALIRAIYANRAENNLIDRIMDYMYAVYRPDWLAANPTLEERDVDFLFCYVTSGLEGIIHKWLLNNPDTPKEVIIEKTEWLMRLTTP